MEAMRCVNSIDYTRGKYKYWVSRAVFGFGLLSWQSSKLSIVAVVEEGESGGSHRSLGRADSADTRSVGDAMWNVFRSPRA